MIIREHHQLQLQRRKHHYFASFVLPRPSPTCAIFPTIWAQVALAIIFKPLHVFLVHSWISVFQSLFFYLFDVLPYIILAKNSSLLRSAIFSLLLSLESFSLLYRLTGKPFYSRFYLWTCCTSYILFFLSSCIFRRQTTWRAPWNIQREGHAKRQIP